MIVQTKVHHTRKRESYVELSLHSRPSTPNDSYIKTYINTTNRNPKPSFNPYKSKQRRTTTPQQQSNSNASASKLHHPSSNLGRHILPNNNRPPFFPPNKSLHSRSRPRHAYNPTMVAPSLHVRTCHAGNFVPACRRSCHRRQRQTV
jgi:hypothetical protein